MSSTSLSSVVCLLAVAALPGVVLPQQRCYSSSLARWFASDEKWTEPPCTGSSCDGGVTRGQLCATGSFSPDSGCVKETGTPGAEFPQCCGRIKCPRRDQCYSPGLQQTFDDGATWTEAPCKLHECRSGVTHIRGCTVQWLGLGCVKTPGVPGAAYPRCCDEVACPRPDQCYSRALQKTFDDTETWTEPPCMLYRCDSGVSRGQYCPSETPGPGCVTVAGTPGVDYPQCCDAVQCV